MSLKAIRNKFRDGNALRDSQVHMFQAVQALEAKARNGELAGKRRRRKNSVEKGFIMDDDEPIEYLGEEESNFDRGAMVGRTLDPKWNPKRKKEKKRLTREERKEKKAAAEKQAKIDAEEAEKAAKQNATWRHISMTTEESRAFDKYRRIPLFPVVSPEFANGEAKEGSPDDDNVAPDVAERREKRLAKMYDWVRRHDMPSSWGTGAREKDREAEENRPEGPTYPVPMDEHGNVLRVLNVDRHVEAPPEHEIHTVLHNDTITNYAVPDEPVVRKERRRKAAAVAERQTVTNDEVRLLDHEDRLEDNRIPEDLRDGDIRPQRRRAIQVLSEIDIAPVGMSRASAGRRRFGVPVEVDVEPTGIDTVAVQPKQYKDVETGDVGEPIGRRSVGLGVHPRVHRNYYYEAQQYYPKWVPTADEIRELNYEDRMDDNRMTGPVPVPAAPTGQAVPNIATDTEEDIAKKKKLKETSDRWDRYSILGQGIGEALMAASDNIRRMNYENAAIWRGQPVAPVARRPRRRYAQRSRGFYPVGDGGMKAVYNRNGKLIGHQVMGDDEYDE
jgi:hypothetical protein